MIQGLRVQASDDFVEKVLTPVSRLEKGPYGLPPKIKLTVEGLKTITTLVPGPQHYELMNFLWMQKTWIHAKRWGDKDMNVGVGLYDPKWKFEGSGVFSHIGNGSTCQDFVVEMDRYDRRKNSVLSLAEYRCPILNVDKDVLRKACDDADNVTPKYLKNWYANVLGGVITEGKYNVSDGQKNILEQIMKEIENYDFLTIQTKERIENKNVSLVTIQTRKATFVVGYNGTINAAPYVLGGLDKIKRQAFVSWIKKQKEFVQEER